MMKFFRFLPCLLLIASAPAAPVKIGAVYCDSGQQRALDEPSWRGVQAAVALRNKAGGINGRPVQLVHIPADSTRASVTAGMRSALEAHPDLVAFVGLSDSDLALVAGREARKAGKVFVTSGATSPLLPNQLGRGFFLACFGDNVQAAAAAEWLRSRGAGKVAVMHDNTKMYTRLLGRYFTEAFQAAGGSVADRVAFRPGEPAGLPRDLSSCDAVFLAAESQDEAERVIGKLRGAGFGGMVVGGDGYDNPAAWQGNPLSKNVFYTTHAYPAQGPGAADRATLSAFRANYRGTPDAFSGLGFDAARVLMDGLARGGKDLARDLQARTAVDGVTGPVRYGRTRVPAKPVALIEAARPREVLRQITPSRVP
jgi:branched-chain amino acid transport system substrate-binding protein